MGLLRNASGLLIPDASGGKPGRANDPEFHIRRLNHFGQGMGIDLSSTHPIFSGKKLWSNDDFPKSDNVNFNSHDEGLVMSKGHFMASEESINQDESGHGGRRRIRQAATDELSHRSPYQHDVFTEGEDMRGVIYKDTSGKTQELATGHSVKWIASPWGGEKRDNKTHRDAMKNISNGFQEFNMYRQRPRSIVSELVNRGINNPSERLMGELQRTAPNMLGSQFLGISHINDLATLGDIRDQIDLKTGNWAKIDPEGYFPD
jgi:hypothetical protein